MGDAKLHADLHESVEEETTRTTFRILLGFWFGVLIAAAGFLSAVDFSARL